MLKLVTKVLTTTISSITTLVDQQEGFRTGRSYTEAAFEMKQVIETSIEYNKPEFLCFIDLQDVFDKIEIKGVLNLLYNHGIPPANLVFKPSKTYILRTVYKHG